MKSSKHPGTTTITFTDSEVEQLKKSLKSFESDRALRVLGDQLLNLFASAEAEEVAEPDEEGWIDWSGGECPVASCFQVDVQLSDGTVYHCVASDDWSWSHDFDGGNIVAYRIHK